MMHPGVIQGLRGSMLNGMTMWTPLLASSSSLGRPIGTPRVFGGVEGAPILFSEIGFCMASCSYIYIYIYIYIIIYVCIDISVKMAAPWGSLTLLSYYSLCPHFRSH